MVKSCRKSGASAADKTPHPQPGRTDGVLRPAVLEEVVLPHPAHLPRAHAQGAA